MDKLGSSQSLMRRLGFASLPSFVFLGGSIFLSITAVVLVLLAYTSVNWERMVFQKESVRAMNGTEMRVWIPENNDEYFLVTSIGLHWRENTTGNGSVADNVVHCVPLKRVAGIWSTCDELSDDYRASGCGGNYIVTSKCTSFPSFGGDLSTYDKDAPEKLHLQLTRSAQATCVVGMICISFGLFIGIFAAALKQVISSILAGTCLLIGAVYSLFATCLMMMRSVETARLGRASPEFNILIPVPLFDDKTVTPDWAMYLSWTYFVVSILAGLSWFLTSYILRVRITNGTISSVWAYRQLCGVDAAGDTR